MTEASDQFVRSALPLRRSLASLLQADLVIQLRNRRALYLSLVLPLILLFLLSAGRGNQRRAQLGDLNLRVAMCLTMGMAAIAIIGYTLSIARDRETGVFQRLRVTPTPSWAIMISRLAVQVAAILTMAVVVLIAAAIFKHLSLTPEAYLLTLLVVGVGAAEFLSIGQALVGLVKSADTINAVSRLVFPLVAVLGIFGHTIILGTTVELIARWSPGGTVVTTLSGAMQPATWSQATWWALLVSVAYCIVFASLGIRWFQWSSR